MHVVGLSTSDRALLCARFGRHGNSHRRMRSVLVDAGIAGGAVAQLDALRALERQFAVDLGSVCWRYERRDDARTHPIERSVIAYITECRSSEDGEVLWLMLDRLREIRDLMEGRLVGEPKP
ncbi:MAG: hypothetical protein ACREL7_18660 [Longimicrobiales bacterium]